MRADGGFLVPTYMADYLIALDRYQQGFGPKPEVPVEVRRTRWQMFRSRIAEPLFGLAYWIDQSVNESLTFWLSDRKVDTDCADRICGRLAWPLYALGRWVVR